MYATALSGITYAGKAVPLYKSEPVVTVPDNYMQILQVNESPVERNNNKFISEVVVQIDIITRQYKESDTSVADAISNSVLQALIPIVNAKLTDTDFQIVNIERDAANYLHEMDGVYHINRKILSIRNHLIEN